MCLLAVWIVQKALLSKLYAVEGLHPALLQVTFSVLHSPVRNGYHAAGLLCRRLLCIEARFLVFRTAPESLDLVPRIGKLSTNVNSPSSVHPQETSPCFNNQSMHQFAFNVFGTHHGTRQKIVQNQH